MRRVEGEKMEGECCWKSGGGRTRLYPIAGHRVIQISVLRSAHPFGVILRTTENFR